MQLAERTQPTTSSRGNTYPAKMRVRARELHAAGWTQPQIIALLEREFGRAPHARTLLLWVNDDAYTAHRHNARNWKIASRLPASNGRFPGRQGREWQEHRARLLRDHGMTVVNVARVMAFDFPDEQPAWTHHRTRMLLGNDDS